LDSALVGRRYGMYQCSLSFLFPFPSSYFYLLLGGAPKRLESPELKSLTYIFVYTSRGRLGKLQNPLHGVERGLPRNVSVTFLSTESITWSRKQEIEAMPEEEVET